MVSSIVGNVRTSSESLLDTSGGLQLPYRKKNLPFFTEHPTIPYFSVFSVWGLSLLLLMVIRVMQNYGATQSSTGALSHTDADVGDDQGHLRTEEYKKLK